jgi:hypothetical protein
MKGLLCKGVCHDVLSSDSIVLFTEAALMQSPTPCGADCEPYLDGACCPNSQTARIRPGPRSLGYRVPEWDEAGVGAAQYSHRPGRRAVRAGEQAQRYRQRQDISARRRGLDTRRLAAVP